MAILHGSWLIQPQQAFEESSTQPSARPGKGAIAGGLLLWGEAWRRITPELLPHLSLEAAAESPTNQADSPTGLSHPYAMTRAELLEFLAAQQEAGKLQFPALPQLEPSVVAAAPKRSRKGQPAIIAAQPEVSEISAFWQKQAIAIPTQFADSNPETPQDTVLIPYHSAAEPTSSLLLFPWQVEGIFLTTEAAIAFLNSLPLGTVDTEESFLGGDLRFWSHGSRWSLDLLARAKFLPGLELSSTATNGQPFANWQPLLDSGVDQERLLQFRDRMPAICRLYQQIDHQQMDRQQMDRQQIDDSHSSELLPAFSSALALALPSEPEHLLLDFLRSALNSQIRPVAQSQPLPLLSDSSQKPAPTKAAPLISPVREWLQALGEDGAIADAPGLPSLEIALQNWTTPLQNRRAENLFRTCLLLHTPKFGGTRWSLEYGLQATDAPDVWVDAATIWNNPVERLTYQGRAIAQPQETLLKGLGLASRLYPPIEPSLQEPRPQFCQLTPLQAYEFLKNSTWRLQDSGLGVIIPPSLAGQAGWANRLGLKIQAETAKLKKGQRLGLQSLLNFRWELTIGGQSISKEEFDRLVALNMPLVEINGEWVELRPQDIRAAQTFFASRKDQPALSLEDALRISTGDTQMIEKLPVVSFEASGALEDLINTLSGKRTLEAIATPTSFQGELRPYQSRGVGWLSFLEQWSLGACLADDMGLGKTIQLIAFLLHLKEQNSLNKPTLLICPTSVLGNWEREVKKFGPSLKVLMHHGDQRPKGKDFTKALKGQDLVLSSYALLYRDLKDLQTISWQGMVLDEAQNIKNPDAKQSQAARQLDAEFRIALTGTPVENRLSELWSILDFLNPGYLGPKNFFQRRFATPIERYGDTSSLQTLRSLVQPFILRRLKTDRDIIQDLPEKQEMTVFCGLSSEQASLYQHLVEKSLADIEAAEGIQRKGIILALLTKLKQLCNHPALFLKEEGQKLDDQKANDAETQAELQKAFNARSGKLKRLEEMLEEVVAEGDRALIFTQFAEWGKLLKAHLEKQLGRETLFLYGSTSRKQREEMVDRFQHDPQGPRLFILSLKAGGVGLNLTRANHVFHFDRWWNPAVENQATDRVFRIGQTRNVQVHKFVCSGTLEEKIHDLIESKKALAEQVVGAGESWLTELNTDQLRDLLLLDRSAIIGEE